MELKSYAILWPIHPLNNSTMSPLTILSPFSLHPATNYLAVFGSWRIDSTSVDIHWLPHTHTQLNWKYPRSVHKMSQSFCACVCEAFYLKASAVMVGFRSSASKAIKILFYTFSWNYSAFIAFLVRSKREHLLWMSKIPKIRNEICVYATRLNVQARFGRSKRFDVFVRSMQTFYEPL